MKRPNRKDAIIAATEELARSKGLSHVTTRAIAAQVGCSEGAIYVYFPGRAELLLAVLESALPDMLATLGELDGQVGHATPQRNMSRALQALASFQERVLPMLASLFAEPELLARYREQFLSRRKGPGGGVARLERYLRAEQEMGRIHSAIDCGLTASTLLGACFFHTFNKLFFGATESFPHYVARLIAAQLRMDEPRVHDSTSRRRKKS